MNISSILITLVGIIIIIALYVVSRLGQSKMKYKETSLLPEIKDENGDVFTSILDDIPASDSLSKPLVNKKSTSKSSAEKHQLVLFISAKNDKGLEGDLIKETLINNGLILGDKNIYHYFVDNKTSIVSETNEQKATSLFRIANGMEPWTLTDSDLLNNNLLGLSMVMLLPSNIDNKTAVRMFVEKADLIAVQVNGTLKNQQQEVLTKEDRDSILRT